MDHRRGRYRWPKIGRDTILLLIGAIGFLHEVWLASADRYSVIAGSLALMGLPFYLRADEKRERRDRGRGDEPRESES